MQILNHTKTEKELTSDDFIVSKTDRMGRIIYGNRAFVKLSGYGESELLHQTHSILRHPEMPKIIFQYLWERIQQKKEIFAYVKNMCKDGSSYWGFANITSTLDKQGNIRDFQSVRRKPSKIAMESIPQLYKQLLAAERSEGIEASKAALEKVLRAKGSSYDKFILTLQQYASSPLL